MILLTSFQAAVVEELLFRGLAFDVFERKFPVWVAILAPSLFFGLAHIFFGPVRVVQTIVIGLLFAILRWQMGSVWGCVIMHFLINIGTPLPAWGGWLAAIGVALLTAGIRFVKSVRRTET